MDLKVENGDLVLTSSNSNLYDLAVDSDLESNDVSLIRKAITTPITYISEWDVNLNVIDDTFGNPLYRKLSEPLTINWIAQARSEVIKSLVGLDIAGRIESIELGIVDLDKIKVLVTYNSQNLEVEI